MGFAAIPARTETVAKMVVDSGFKVHSALGPGLLESAYEHCLAHELASRGCAIARQVALPIVYGGVTLEAGYRIDILAADCVVIELKSVEGLAPVHHAQVLTYLKLSGHRLGLLMNFNVELFKHGVKRFVL